LETVDKHFLPGLQVSKSCQTKILVSIGGFPDPSMRGTSRPARAPSGEKLVRQFKRVNQRIDLGTGVIHRK
jgi:hypothetical protein